MASVQTAGWSKTECPKGLASLGLAFWHTPSVRWGQQQGILGHRPTQKSDRPGIGILTSVCEDMAIAHAVLVKKGPAERNGTDSLPAGVVTVISQQS